MIQRRYYVRREECWGGTYLYFVADRDRHRHDVAYQASCLRKSYRTEAGAQAMCTKANADWERFLRSAGEKRKMTTG